MSAVLADGLTVSLGGHVVLNDVSFAVPEGAFVGVLGPNGAGKTTLFRAMLGVVPHAGRVRVVGPVGYMPQGRGPLPARLIGHEVVAGALHGRRWGLPSMSRGDRAEVARVLALVDAGTLAARPVGALSGGERQRLLLAQALLGAPRVLLLDEPLQGLDPRRQAEVVALVSGLQRRLRLTVLFSAHELNPLLGALDLVLYLGGGGAALGTVDEVVTGPVLSRLYGAPIDVVRAGGRVFVMSGQQGMEQACSSIHV